MFINPRRIQGTFVKLDDGSIIEVAIGSDGNMEPIRIAKAGAGLKQDPSFGQLPQANQPVPNPQWDPNAQGDPLGLNSGGITNLGFPPLNTTLSPNPYHVPTPEEVEQENQELSLKPKAVYEKADNNRKIQEKIQEQLNRSLEYRERTGYWEDRPFDIPPLDHAFRARLSSIMTDNKYDRRLKGRTRGSIDLTRLHKVPTGSTSVFTRKEARKGKNYNVVLVLDQSGSMDDQIEVASSAIIEMAKAFDGLVDLAILGFHDNVFVHKYFEAKLTNYTLAYKEMVARCDGGTDDFEALKRAYEMLNGRQGNNLVIFMTDGQGHDTQTMHHLVKANESLATTIGVGIGITASSIPDNVTASSSKELKKKLVDIIGRKIKRG